MPELYVEPMTDRWTCFKCKKVSNRKKKLLKCAGCEAITYCSRDCQEQDWARHRYNCVPVMVTEIPGKGRGLVAAKDIKKGELIFKEKDAIKLKVARIRKSDTVTLMAESVDEKFVKSLKDQVENLPTEAKSLFFQLEPTRNTGDFYPSLSRAGFSESDINIVRLFINNAKKISNEDNTIVLRLNLELVNHSCSPNAINEPGDTDVESELRAIKDICKGDEVTLCYLDDFMNFGSIARKRRTKLEKVVGFDCKCPVCSGKVPGQDKLMKKLIELHTKVDRLPLDLRREAGIRDKIVDVFLDLNIGHPNDLADAVIKMVEAVKLTHDPALLRIAMDKCRLIAEDTKLKQIQRFYEHMERVLAQRCTSCKEKE